MTDIATTVDRHLAAYCEPDRSRRDALIAAAWADTGSLIDPPLDGSGRDGISAMTDALLHSFPGHSLKRTSDIDFHHSFGRYEWALDAPDGTAAVTGTDFVEVDPAGRLVRVVGFFGDLPRS